MAFLVVVVVLVFGVIVLVHEFGHMLAAKACGVAVPDFAIGMGPSLFSFKRGGTRYHLCALPIGGFVNIAGMVGDDPLNNHEQDQVPVSQQWRSKNGWQKSLILCAGAMMNMLLALVVMFSMGLVGFPQRMVEITAVAKASPAAEAGLKAGDYVTGINGQQIRNSHQFMKLVQHSYKQPVQLDVLRQKQHLAIVATPRVIPGYNSNLSSLGIEMKDTENALPVIGIVDPKSDGYKLGLRVNDRVTGLNGKPVNSGLDVVDALAFINEDYKPVDADGNPIPASAPPIVLEVERRTERGQTQNMRVSLPGNTTALSLGIAFKPKLVKLPFDESIKRSLEDARFTMAMMVQSIHLIFTPEGMRSISGPVGIARVIGQSAKSGLYQFLQIVMLININLGLLNLLPLPALDGGRLVFVALGGIGIRIPEKREALVHAIGMIMLLGLIGLVTLTDLRSLFF